MDGWFNWREIEKNNDWGVRDKSEETSALWGESAENWDEKTQEKQEFTRLQAQSLKLSKEDIVLDICCGTGPLSLAIAPYVKGVIAFDYSESMLECVEKKAKELGLNNVKLLQGNWYTAVPGKDIPICNISITRHSPAQGDILKMSKTADKYCYSLWNCYSKDTSKIVSAMGNATKNKKMTQALCRPDGRLFGFNVHFNLLYDSGANPAIHYVEQTIEHKAKSKSELFDFVYPQKNKQNDDLYKNLYQMFEREVLEMNDGTFQYHKKNVISVLGWDPNEIILTYI